MRASTTYFLPWSDDSDGQHILHRNTFPRFAKQGDIAHDGTNLLVYTIKREWAKWRTIEDAMANDGMRVV